MTGTWYNRKEKSNGKGSAVDTVFGYGTKTEGLTEK